MLPMTNTEYLDMLVGLAKSYLHGGEANADFRCSPRESGINAARAAIGAMQQLEKYVYQKD